MFSDECSYVRRDMASGEKEVGAFLLDLMEFDRVTKYNSDLQHRNIRVIKWLEEHGAPAEMITQAKDDAAQGNNAILTVCDEIRLSGIELWVVPAEVLKLFLEAAGPKATALFIQCCKEYFEWPMHTGEKDYRE